jgi:alkaline phosphatase D
VWDDNDYAQNDGNKYFIYKDVVKKLYLNFLDEPINSKRRKIGRGMYETYTFGHTLSHRSVRIILLDVRYHKTSFFDSNRDILGEEQWSWLENMLQSHNETFTFISSGTQILPIDRLATECWLPESRQRLFKLIAKLKKSGVILLTGDIHNGQILRTPCKIQGRNNLILN